MTNKEKFYQLANNIIDCKDCCKWTKFFNNSLDEVKLLIFDNIMIRYRSLERGFGNQCWIQLFKDFSYIDLSNYCGVIKEDVIETCHFTEPNNIDRILEFISKNADKEVAEQLLDEIEIDNG